MPKSAGSKAFNSNIREFGRSSMRGGVDFTGDPTVTTSLRSGGTTGCLASPKAGPSSQPVDPGRRIYNPAAMDRKCLEIIGLTWDLAKQEHNLLALVIPATLNVAKCISEGRQPTTEEIQAWNEVNAQLARRMSDITASFTSVREAVTPMLRFDA
jgi:hypothetical protein